MLTKLLIALVVILAVLRLAGVFTRRRTEVAEPRTINGTARVRSPKDEQDR